MILVPNYYISHNPKSARIIYGDLGIYSNFTCNHPKLIVDDEDMVRDYVLKIKCGMYVRHIK